MAISVDLYLDSKTQSSIRVYGSVSTGGTNAIGYEFTIDGGASGSGYVSLTPTTSTTKYFTYSGLSPGTTYFMRVTFTFQGGATQSSTLYATTDSPPSPSPITGLGGWINGDGYSPGSLSFSWNASYPATYYSYSLLRNGSTYTNSTTSSTSVSFSSLPSGTYQLYLVPYNGSISGSGTYSSGYTIQDKPNLVPSAPVVNARPDGGLGLSWGYISQASYYELYYKPSSSSSWSSATVYSTSTTLTLTYGVVYDFKVRTYSSFGYSDFSYINSATVNPKTPSISGDYNGATVTIYTSGVTGTFDSIIVDRQNYSSGSVVDSKSVSINGGYVQWAIPSDQIANYKFRAYSVSNGVTSNNYSSVLSFQRPQNFNWTGGDKVTGNNFTVTASDWNSLATRVNQFRTYKGLATKSFTTVSSGSSITAAIFNQVATAINDMNSTGGVVPIVTKGDTATAYLFNRLKNCLNTIY